MKQRTIAIIGGGPAGLMAAEVLARHGCAVTIFERMPTPARKFLMAGRGGLNITHSEPRDAVLSRYGSARERLAAALDAFPPQAVRDWCAGLGEQTFTGTSGRVFPKSFKASPLLRAWLRRLDASGVQMRTRHHWQGFGADDALVFDAPTGSVQVNADATLFALGGASWPRLGADGSWTRPFGEMGIAVDPLKSANCCFLVRWTQPFQHRFAGTPLKAVRLSHAGTSLQGEAMITTGGIEGGGVYALSRVLRETMELHGTAELMIDLRPHQDIAALAQRLARPHGKQSLANHLRKAGLDALAINLLREVTGNRLPNEADSLAGLIKALPLRLTGMAAVERAISTAGGVNWQALDGNLMLRAMPGHFVAGEMLSWDAPTGGYLLQACLATGVQAANGILRYLEKAA